MNEKELNIVKEYKFDNPLFHKVDSIIDGCYRDCHNKFFHTYKYVCIHDIKLTNIQIMKYLIHQFLMKAWVCMN